MRPVTVKLTKYDADVRSVIWARAKVQAEIARLDALEAQLVAEGMTGLEGLEGTRQYLRQVFLGPEGCLSTVNGAGLALFDLRLPAVAAVLAATGDFEVTLANGDRVRAP